MADLKVCRVCLQMNVSLFTMQSNSLEEYYELITGTNRFLLLKFPIFACYECASLLLKFYKFRQKCLRSLLVLQDILHNKDQITEQDIQKVNKESFKSTLSISKNIYAIDIDPEKEEHSDIIDTKVFPNVPLDNLFFDMEPFDTVADPDWPSDDDFKDTVEIKEEYKSDECKIEAIEIESEPKQKRKTPMRKAKKVIKKEKSPAPISKKHKIRLRKGNGLITQADISMPKDVDLQFDDNFTVAVTTKEEQIDEMRKRQECERYRSAEFKCELCYKCFSNAKLWQAHAQRHDPSSGGVECEVCRLRFADEAPLKRHMYSVHSKKFMCNQCPFTASTFNRAKQHMLFHKGVKYKCPHCDEVATNLNAILGHVRKRHSSDVLCAFCGLPFVSRMGLLRHKALMHKDRDEKTEIAENSSAPRCAECDMKFASHEAYKRHFLTARKHKDAAKDTIGCRECGETFADEQARREHARTAHERAPRLVRPPETWPDKCPLCSERVTSAKSLWAHFRMNHPHEEYPRERRFVCDVCGARMRHKKGLEVHKFTHLSEKPFKCARCGKGFNSAANRALHDRSVHSDARPHQCPLCHRAFKKKNTLKCHFMTHTGEKPYRCAICDHAFTQSNSCKSHIRKVHGELPPKILTVSKSHTNS